jgi:ubiquinone/menaquinone biosynthesis C-methylase UbiE
MRNGSIGTFILLTTLTIATPARPQDAAHPNRPSEDRIHRFESQTVSVEDFTAEGYVLDVGGGGEGIIGLLKPAQVVAIDINRRELAEAPAGPLKIVMDATDMKFLDRSFKTVTCFFTLMYMKPADQARTLAEISRVLEAGGRLLLWDVIIPERIDASRDIAVYPMLVKLPGREVKTGYGTLWPDKLHDVKYFEELARNAGFQVVSSTGTGRTFRLELVKP